VISKPKRCSGLGDAGTVSRGGRGGFHFAVKINFKGQGGGIENSAAILAGAQVALDFTRDLRR
jgi:hypothetical protein